MINLHLSWLMVLLYVINNRIRHLIIDKSTGIRQLNKLERRGENNVFFYITQYKFVSQRLAWQPYNGRNAWHCKHYWLFTTNILVILYSLCLCYMPIQFDAIHRKP